MPWKPNKWIATSIAIFFQPLAFLYVCKPRIAVGVFVAMIAAATICMVRFNSALMQPELQYLSWAVSVACAVFAYKIAAQSDYRELRPLYSRWYVLICIPIALVIFVLGVRSFLVEPFKAPSSSMEPTINYNSIFLIKKWDYGHYGAFGIRGFRRPISAQIKRGDVIAFEYPVDLKTLYLKRVVGLPGDKIAYQNNHLYVNGKDTLGPKLQDYLTTEKLIYASRYVENLGESSHDIIFANFDRSVNIPPRYFEDMDKCVFSVERIYCEIPKDRYFVLGDFRDNSADSRHWGFVRSDQIIGTLWSVM